MDEDNKAEASNTIQIRRPKRILHCSDGVYEEYSSDEEEVPVDPKNLSLIRRIGHSIVFGLDYVGKAYYLWSLSYQFIMKRFRNSCKFFFLIPIIR